MLEKISKINYNIINHFLRIDFMKKNVFLFESSRIHTPCHFAIMKGYTRNVVELTQGFHWHDYFEVEIVLEGRSEHILNNKSYQVSRGDTCLFTYFDFHTHQPINDEYATLFNFNFDQQALPENIINILLSLPGALTCRFEEDELQDIISDIELIDREQFQPNDAIHQTYMTTIFTKIILTILRKCGIEHISNLSDEQTPFNRAVALMQCHFRENITLNGIANRVGLTPNYLGQLFKKNFDKTFNEYLKSIRLRYSQNLLKYSNYSIATIAELCGFKTPSYFIQCFREEYDITPKQFCLKKDMIL